jgi:hypothetical protein
VRWSRRVSTRSQDELPLRGLPRDASSERLSGPEEDIGWIVDIGNKD